MRETALRNSQTPPSTHSAYVFSAEAESAMVPVPVFVLGGTLPPKCLLGSSFPPPAHEPQSLHFGPHDRNESKPHHQDGFSFFFGLEN